MYLNQVGGNDELIFDGGSMALDGDGEAIAVLPSFEEAVVTVDLGQPGIQGLYAPQEPIAGAPGPGFGPAGLPREVRLQQGCGGALRRGGLRGHLLPGGPGPGSGNVLGVLMPSPYTSRESIVDSRKLAANLGVEVRLISIAPIYQCYRESLQELRQLGKIQVTLENIQARIRGNLLMAISNKFSTWCCLPATRANWRWATAPFTAT